MPIVSRGYVLDEGITDTKTLILVDPEKKPLMCTLTQIDLENNTNKFIVLHAIQTPSGYYLYSRSGRVGQKGRSTTKQCSSEAQCIKSFMTKFKALTANVWTYRDKFELRKDHYSVFSYGEKEPDTETKIETSKKDLDFIPGTVEYFVSLFTTKIDKIFEAAMCNMEIDSTKLPIGMVSSRNIQKAKDILCYLQENLKDIPKEKLIRASEQYFGIIPPMGSNIRGLVIDSETKIQEKYNHLDDLEKMTRTIELVTSEDFVVSSPDPMTIFRHKMKALNPGDPEYGLIFRYFNNSRNGTHGFNLNIEHIYTVYNPVQTKIFKEKFGSKRRELLIHGSRLCNWQSILYNGLLIDPCQKADHITGKMFGNGIYFANMFSKSAQYCMSKIYNCKTEVCLALAEVAVGEQKKCISENRYNKENIKPYDSVWGVGRNCPSSEELFEDIHVPTGKIDYSPNKNARLYYDEKIIYDQEQYTFRFMVIASMS